MWDGRFSSFFPSCRYTCSTYVRTVEVHTLCIFIILYDDDGMEILFLNCAQHLTVKQYFSEIYVLYMYMKVRIVKPAAAWQQQLFQICIIKCVHALLVCIINGCVVRVYIKHTPSYTWISVGNMKQIIRMLALAFNI